MYSNDLIDVVNSEQVISSFKESEGRLDGQLLILEDYFHRFVLAGKIQDAIEIFEFIVTIKARDLWDDIRCFFNKLANSAKEEYDSSEKIMREVEENYFF